MSRRPRLERRFRRLLRWYPRVFREEHEEEMLAVLMASARDGERHPDAADAANLIANALLMRLRPGAPRSAPTVFWAVRLMWIGAALQLVALATVIGTQSDLAAAITRHFPAITAPHAQALAHRPVPAIAIGAPVAAVIWLLLAWANGRGHGWARGAFTVMIVLTTVSLLASLSQHSATLAPADLVAGGVLWLAGLVALALILSPASERHYHRARR